MTETLDKPLPYARALGSTEPAPRGTLWVFRLALAAAAVAVGYAIHVRDGEYWPAALRWVGWAVALTVAGVAFPRGRTPRWGGGVVLAAVFAAVAFQFALLLTDSPGGANWWSNDLVDTSARNFLTYNVLVRAAWLGLLLALWLADRRWGRWAFGLVLVAHLLLGAWMIRSSPKPRIDVFVFQQGGAQALLHGDNPYAVRYPDIYRDTKQGDRAVYGPGLSAGGKVAFGFPYPPLSLFLSTAGYAALGDHRYAQLIAMTLAGALIAYNRPGRGMSRVALLAAAGLLFTPRAFFVLGRGWTEPFVALGLAGVVFVARRSVAKSPSQVRDLTPSPGTPGEGGGEGPGEMQNAECRMQNAEQQREQRQAHSSILHSSFIIHHFLLGLALGFFLATKQYLALAGPAALVLLPRPFRVRPALILLGTAVVVAVALTAPLAFWDLPAFVHSTWTVQQVAPFREDALSYAVRVYQSTGVRLGPGAALAAVLPASALALWRAPRGAAGFAAASALTFLPFIALNKQAFANYYYFTIAALWAAVAAADDGNRAGA